MFGIEVGSFLATILPALGIGTIVGGFSVALVKRNTDKEANQINEKDVNTRAVQSTLELLMEGQKELRLELSEAKSKGAAQEVEIAKLREEVRCYREERAELFIHIGALEALVPNPPGAPPRPTIVMAD